MPASVQVSSLLTEVRRRGNFETNDQANAFATDAEILALLNTYFAEFYDELVAAKGPAYFRAAPWVIATVANQASYALASDHYKVISVDITWGQNIVRSARPYEEAERNRYKWLGEGWNYDTPVFYQIQGSPLNPSIPQPPSIVFQPIPSGITNITVNYIPVFTPLLSTQYIDSINGWSDFAVYMAISDLKDKDDADSSPWIAKAERLRQRIRALAESVDLAEPPRVQRVRRRAWDRGF
jgi:hypothetical protein